MQNLEYRNRIYKKYLSVKGNSLFAISIKSLKPRKAYLNNLIDKYFPSNLECSALEIGCGHGALMYFAQKRGYSNICGVDSSAEQVEVAFRLGVKHVEQGDLMSTISNAEDASLDMVIAFDVIEHFDKNELIELIDAVHRVLKPGGKWIVHVPNAGSPFFGKILYGDFTHEIAFTSNSVSQLLISSGYSDVRCYEDKPIACGIKGFIRLLLWETLRAFLILYLAAETGTVDKKEIFSQNMLVVAHK